MRRLLFSICFITFYLVTNAQQMGQGNLPPIFSNDRQSKTQFDNRVRAFISPTRIMWLQNGDLISNPENLLKQGNGQATTASVPRTTFSCRDGKRPSILLDFGKEIHGGLQFVTCITNSHKPVRVRVRLGESVSEAMSEPYGGTNATNDHAMRDYNLELPWLGVAEVGNSGFRFARVDFLDDNISVPIKEIRAMFIYQDIPYIGSFKSSNPRIDSIWMTGAYTVHLNLQEYLFEAPKRDRLVWLGDLHPEVRTALAVFGDNHAIARSLDFARDETPIPAWMNGLSSYSLWWLIIHKDYYMYHGDMAYLKEQQKYMKDLLENIMTKISPEGEEQLDGVFLDHESQKNPEAVKAGIQALAVLGLDAGGKLMEELGDNQLASRCFETANKMRKIKRNYSANKQSAALAALAGIIPAEEANVTISEGGVKDYATFYGYYMLNGKAMANDYKQSLNAISDFWGAMLDLGATTFWESFDRDQAKNAMRIDEMPVAGKIDFHTTYGQGCYSGLRNSFCHGWASGPTAWLSEYVLGISIIEPGFKAIKISPNLGDLEWVEGSVPTPYGVIKLRHDKQDDGSIKTIVISKPKQVKIIK